MNSRNIKNLRIIRILLNNLEDSLTKYKIAKLSGCSTAWVIEFLGKLELLNLVRGTKILNKDKLVDYYIEKAPKEKFFDFYVKNPIEFLKRVELDYALTTYGAENLTTHILFPSRYDIYIKEKDLEEWKKSILKDGLIGKGNLRLIIAKDETILNEARNIKKIKIVSESQLLIDLKREGGVCIEAYNIIIKNV